MRYRLTAFLVSGALGAVAGSMYVLVRSTVSPLDIGFPLVVLALTMIIVGGTLSWKGALLGALIFTWLPEVLDFVGHWKELIYGLIVAVAAVLLPRGIYGLALDWKRSLQRRARATPDAAPPTGTPTATDEPTPPSHSPADGPEMEVRR